MNSNHSLLANPFRQLKHNLITIGAWTFIGRVLGLLKDTLLINFLGLGATADAFFLAYRIPNLFRATFAEGSIPGVMVPLLTEQTTSQQLVRARRLLGMVLLIFSGASMLVLLFFWLYPNFFLQLIAFGLDGERLALCSQFLAILMVLLPLFSFASIIGSLLQAIGSFAVNAAGPAIFNAVGIVVLLAAIYLKATPTMLCVGILLAGLAKLWSRYAVLQYHRLTPLMPDAQSTNDLIIAGSRFLPLLSGILFSTANASLETLVASFLPVGQIALMHYVFRLFNLLLYSISLPLEHTMLPQLTKVNQQSKLLSFYLLESCKTIFHLTMPTSLFIWCIAPQLCQVLLGASSSLAQLTLAAAAIKIMALAVSLNIVQRNLSRFFYACFDTATPTVVWGTGIIANGLVCLLAVYYFNAEIIAILSLTVASWAMVVGIKLWLLARREVTLDYQKLAKFGLQLIVGCLPTTILLWFGGQMMTHLMPLVAFNLLGRIGFGFGLMLLWWVTLYLCKKLRQRLFKAEPQICHFFD